ncbi:MAG TPA: OmpA family protein [Myxococcota bacterium]|nr:OmpA family protein [Myxococcota bacterium]
MPSHPASRSLFALSAALGLASPPLTPAALAETRYDLAIEQFEPLPGLRTNLLNIARPRVMGHLSPTFGLALHFQDDPLMLVDAEDPDQIEQRIVDHVVKGELWLGLGLFDRLELGVVMPVVLSQDAARLATDPGEPLPSTTLADLRLVTSLLVLDPSDHGGFGLSLSATMHLPTGDAESYQSEGRVRVEPRLALGFESEALSVTANVGLLARGRRDLMNFVSTDALRWGAGVEVPLVERLALFAVAYGAIGIGDVDLAANNAAPAEALGGVNAWLAEDWGISVAAGGGLTTGVGSPDFRAVLTVGYAPDRERDRDGDGLLDEVDRCPDEPEDKDGFGDEDGCPDPDNDLDGILDAADRCPGEREDQDGFEDADGCPDPDNDKDGIADLVDGPRDTSGFGACRDQAEDKDGFEDQEGCPDLDNDKDGVADLADGAPDESGFGRCRDEAETFNAWEDDDGCPDIKPKAVLTESAIRILERVYFDFDKATLQDRSYPVLDAVAALLVENPGLTLVRVEGHTDEVGTRRYNLDLSLRRAKAVVKYLRTKGIAASRLIARGYGFDYPLQSNTTQEGRDLNRRVEFNILEIDAKPIKNPVLRSSPAVH